MPRDAMSSGWQNSRHTIPPLLPFATRSSPAARPIRHSRSSDGMSSLLVHRGLFLGGITLASQRPLRTRPVCLTRLEPACYRGARAEVAQLAEHSPEKAGVDSSILSL